jgi:hypothetical protein
VRYLREIFCRQESWPCHYQPVRERHAPMFECKDSHPKMARSLPERLTATVATLALERRQRLLLMLAIQACAYFMQGRLCLASSCWRQIRLLCASVSSAARPRPFIPPAAQCGDQNSSLTLVVQVSFSNPLTHTRAANPLYGGRSQSFCIDVNLGSAICHHWPTDQGSPTGA